MSNYSDSLYFLKCSFCVVFLYLILGISLIPVTILIKTFNDR
jgi:hypothetical protein